MTELMPPAWIRGTRFPPEADRQIIRVLRRYAGVQGPDDMRVTANAPANLQVRVNSGRCIIDGTIDDLQQGSYACTAPDARQLSIPVSNPNQQMIHRVVAIVDDSDFGGAALGWDRRVIAGTAGQGAPNLPANAIALARVTMPAGAQSVAAGQITDDRNLINPNLALLSHTHSLWPWMGATQVPRNKEVVVQAALAAPVVGQTYMGVAPGAGNAVIGFPMPFENACVSVVVNAVYQSAPTGLYLFSPFDFRTNLFRIRVFQIQPQQPLSVAGGVSVTVAFVAVGW